VTTAAVTSRAPSFEALLARPDLAWMGQNTTHLEPPPEVVAALLDSTRRHEFQWYAPALGFEELRELIAADLGLPGRAVMITDGAVGGLHHICTALASGLSRLITTDPGWPWPGRFVALEGVPVTAVGVYSDEAGYRLSAAALAEVIEPRSLLYLIDPLNPLGSSYGRAELEAIVALARAHDAIIVHDCTYRHFADGHTLVAELYPEATLTTYSFSKWLGLAGLRAGGVSGDSGLPAVLVLGELERERDVGLVVAVGVDVDPVDRAGVELRAGHRGRDRGRGAGRVGVQDQHGRARVIGRGEHEDIGEVQAAVVAGELQVVGAEVVRHGVGSAFRG